jgi:OOP family OmpA-OmpF porin|tara:strand:+ start:2153 stop:3301 length:1149 start_codon:yes stop_codon:yes gene_type:complete
MRAIQISLTIILSALSLVSVAKPLPGVTVFPQVGLISYSGSSDIEIDPNYGLGVGYQFSNPWAVELTYLKGSSSLADANSTSVDAYLWHLNGLYHFTRSEKIRPYFTFGLGESNINIDAVLENTEKQINAGLGVKWQAWKNTDLRTEFKLYESEADNVIRSTFNIGIHHVISNASSSSKRKISQLATLNSDSDADGISNSNDQCPNSPSGQSVNKVGCFSDKDKDKDKDKDGVADAKDKCPGTTNRANVIDTQGCYVNTRNSVALNVLFNFDFDSFATKPEHTEEVNKIVKFAKKHSGASIELSGHTDSVGTATYNLALSKARVAAVAKLVEMNTRIPRGRINKNSYGEMKPMAENDTFANRRANRRVEGTVTGVSETPKQK